MSFNSFFSNQGTQTPILTDNTGGTISGTVIAVQKVDLSGQGTAGTIWNGGVTGTINTGTLLQVQTLGTINSATVASLPNLPGGSIVVTAGTQNLSQWGGTTVSAAGSLGDSMGNPIAPATGANLLGWNTTSWERLRSNEGDGAPSTGLLNLAPMQYNGTTYDRIRGDTTNGQWVNMKAGIINTGTINSATISSLPNIPGGTINLATIAGGSIVQTAGTTSVGTINTGTINVATITGGSIVVTAGTMVGNGGSMIAYGPAAAAAAATGNPLNVGGTDSGGTIRTIKVDSGGLQRIGLDSGTISVGTINTGTLNAGTINAATIVAGSIVVTAGTQSTGTVNTGTINTGTINAATVNAGTIQLNPLPATNTISNVGTSGTLGIGTLLGSASVGAGTAMYITYYSILGVSGTPECTLAFGTQINGPQVIYHGLIPAGGGIVIAKLAPHGYGTTNANLTYQINSGAGTVSWSVDYFLHT